MQHCTEKWQHNQSRTDTVPATIASSMCAGSRCAGSRCAGNRCAYWQSSASHCSVCRFINIVLLALVTSVTCFPPSTPPVKFWNTSTHILFAQFSSTRKQNNQGNTLDCEPHAPTESTSHAPTESMCRPCRTSIACLWRPSARSWCCPAASASWPRWSRWRLAGHIASTILNTHKLQVAAYDADKICH